MANHSDTTRSARKYPRTCSEPGCRKKQVYATVIDRQFRVKHDGKLHEFVVRDFPVEKCSACDSITIGSDSDEILGRALREHLGFLLPSQVREGRIVLGHTQKYMASLIGCASETLSRWESGVLVQSAAYDRMLRSYFGLPQLRDFLLLLKTRPTLGNAPVFNDDACVRQQVPVPCSAADADMLSVPIDPATRIATPRSNPWRNDATAEQHPTSWPARRRSRSLVPNAPTLRLVGGRDAA